MTDGRWPDPDAVGDRPPIVLTDEERERVVWLS